MNEFTRTYRIVMAACRPWVSAWGRLEVAGLEELPAFGPVLLAGNHDSLMDPVVVGVAARQRRQIRALAKSSLWDVRGLGPILRGMGQIPIDRGRGDAHALDWAVDALQAGSCIGIFPECTISRGWTLRARSGLGRLAQAVPEAKLVCVAVTGSVDYAKFPKRPRVRVEFFAPESGQPAEGEEATAIAVRLLAEIRERAPIVTAGRRRTAAKWLAEGERRAREEAQPRDGRNVSDAVPTSEGEAQ
jgi:1-acyl-sn-glycerol-3-phosphate acyltransferase